MANAFKTVKLERQKIIAAHNVWQLLSTLSFQNNNAITGVIENAEIAEASEKKIRKALEKIRDKHIKHGPDKKPLMVYGKDENGNPTHTAVDWDWTEGPVGRDKAQKEQEGYMLEEEEIRAYTMRQSYLTPCWRYVSGVPGQMADREEIFHTPRDISRIRYCFVSDSALEEKEGEDNE